ncbi:hypothetical protein [Oryzihumus leptocrescens]|uniref:Uncharacterized protein n=1 Tax=Oryzihumus leptocrescens TaxID=297536 RepID=A0A542ZEP6_9MICO|nr:hypothetical protein [Oryzihumus leptocrescens]TQL58787.1 hypothetical protein FB474_0126 [Oryzihumus leptocrescens]
MRSFVLDRQAFTLRWVLAPAALVAAAAHVPVIGPHLTEAPYMGVLFVVLTAACVALAVAAMVRDTMAVYALAALTCTLAIVGYIATRLVAFPMLADDVGNWFEPMGVLSVGSEAIVVVTAGLAFRAVGGRAQVHDSSGDGSPLPV